MSFNTEYEKLKKEFDRISNKILNYETRRELSSEDRRKQYTEEILKSYNEFLSINKENLSKQSESLQKEVNEKFEKTYESKFIRCLKVLGFCTVLPKRYEPINSDSLVQIDPTTIASDDEDKNLKTRSDVSQQHNIVQTQGGPSNSTGAISETGNSTQIDKNLNNTGNMVLTRVDYHNLCTRTINVVFSGDPLGLQAFIDSIESLEELDEANEFTSTLKRCILMKLQGTARDCISSDPNLTIAQIKAQLKEKIKPESSLVVEGRMMALKADRTNFSEYAKRAEALAEQFQRSLILEGMPHELAQRDTIRKTVELCRSNSNMVGVKTVLSSTKFENAKAVIATFITQTRQETNEHQVLQMRQTNRGTNSNRFIGSRGRNNNFRGNYYGNNQNNRSGNNFGRNNYQNNQNNRGGYRGRRYQNYRNNNNNNNNNNGNWRTGQNRANNRVYYAENESAPPPGAPQPQPQVQLNQAGH